MNRRISKANSITTYDTATLWRALEASSVNQQNQIPQKDTARRWQRAANRLLRQNTITSISPNNDHLSRSSSGINSEVGEGSGVINSVLNCSLQLL
jgi:hypothetical protein